MACGRPGSRAIWACCWQSEVDRGAPDRWWLQRGLRRLKTRVSALRGASPVHELARTSFNSVGIRAVGAIFGFAFNVVLSRTLGPAGTGAVMFYLNFAALTGLIATGGMDIVGLRELARHAEDGLR